MNISKELMTIKKNNNLDNTAEIKRLFLVRASLICDLSLVVYFVFSLGT